MLLFKYMGSKGGSKKFRLLKRGGQKSFEPFWGGSKKFSCPDWKIFQPYQSNYERSLMLLRNCKCHPTSATNKIDTLNLNSLLSCIDQEKWCMHIMTPRMMGLIVVSILPDLQLHCRVSATPIDYNSRDRSSRRFTARKFARNELILV